MVLYVWFVLFFFENIFHQTISPMPVGVFPTNRFPPEVSQYKAKLFFQNHAFWRYIIKSGASSEAITDRGIIRKIDVRSGRDGVPAVKRSAIWTALTNMTILSINFRSPFSFHCKILSGKIRHLIQLKMIRASLDIDACFGCTSRPIRHCFAMWTFLFNDLHSEFRKFRSARPPSFYLSRAYLSTPKGLSTPN